MDGERDRKVAGLKRRMREISITEGEVAAAVGLTSRDAVTSWKLGRAWPHAPGEEKLEVVLNVPRGFFAALAAGATYEEAILSGPPADDDKDMPRRLFDALLDARPLDTAQGHTLQKAQAHIMRQVEMLFSFVFPNVPITPDGIHKLRLSLGRLGKPPKKKK